MPDILIRGMEMPHIYDTVRFAMDVGSGKMFALNLYDETTEWHPVEELPQHGDLISKQAALAALYSDYAYAAMDVIEEVPVVVPAEKGEGK